MSETEQGYKKHGQNHHIFKWNYLNHIAKIKVSYYAKLKQFPLVPHFMGILLFRSCWKRWVFTILNLIWGIKFQHWLFFYIEPTQNLKIISIYHKMRKHHKEPTLYLILLYWSIRFLLPPLPLYAQRIKPKEAT